MVEFIAEVSSNHNRDLSRMKEFIYASESAGCTGIKFQLFKIDKLFSTEILEKSETHRKRKTWELPEELIPELADLTNKLGLKFSCSPFYLGAVDILEPYVDFFKVASYELLWLNLFKKCGNTGKPVVFSTGMATTDEVENTLGCLFETECQEITILHCNSAYPTPIEDANLKKIETLNTLIHSIEKPDGISIKVGYSDHTVSPAVLYRTIHHYGVDMVEFHLDLDGKGEEFKAGHCWLPEKIEGVIKNINEGIKSDGHGEFGPSKSELPEREWRSDPIDGLRPLKGIRNSFEK
mgnify:CR=1 FL=1